MELFYPLWKIPVLKPAEYACRKGQQSRLLYLVKNRTRQGIMWFLSLLKRASCAKNLKAKETLGPCRQSKVSLSFAKQMKAEIIITISESKVSVKRLTVVLPKAFCWVFLLTKLSSVAIAWLLPWPCRSGTNPGSDPCHGIVTSLSFFCPHPGLCHDALSLRQGLPSFCIPHFSQHVAQYGESRRGIQRHPVHQPRMTVRSLSEDGTKSKPVAWLFHIWLFKRLLSRMPYKSAGSLI